MHPPDRPATRARAPRILACERYISVLAPIAMPRPSAATCGPGQPVPGSCPASPSAAAGLAVPPAITLQSLRRRHRRQFCSPQPWQLRARASSIRRRRNLTPRAGQRHQPLTARPNRPSLAPSPPAPPIRSHLSSSANAAAAPRQRPGRLADLQPAMPPPPHPLGSTSSTSRLVPGGHVGLDGTIASRHPTATTPSSRNRSCDRARRLELLPNHQSPSLHLTHSPSDPTLCTLDVPPFARPPAPHRTHPSSVGPAPAKPTCVSPPLAFRSKGQVPKKKLRWRGRQRKHVLGHVLSRASQRGRRIANARSEDRFSACRRPHRPRCR